MGHTLDFYWDFSSPFAYLGSTQAAALAGRTGATLTWRPMLLGAVFKAVGTADAPILTWPDVKRTYYFRDLTRWAEHWGVPFRFPSRFPTMTVKPLRAYLALPEARRKSFMDATFRAYWAEDRDIADEGVLREIIGQDADDVVARMGTKEVKDALFAATQHAIDAGVFGAPAWVVDGKELFWGQDRVVLVERALRA
jgi:2-hydroxychromene-2-carboxylate isomerase